MKNNRTARRYLAKIALLLTSLFLSFLLAEVAVRLFFSIDLSHRPRLSVEQTPAGILQPDQTLGWRTAENVEIHAKSQDFGGQQYDVFYSTKRGGTRSVPDSRTGKTKVLVLGDSFTMAAGVSDDQTYYNLLARQIGLDITAYGGGGYGTLQESMILKELLQKNEYDLILLQFCANDFINNSLILERASKYNNNAMRRPYLSEEGKIIYATPVPFSGMSLFLMSHSKLVYMLTMQRIMRNAQDADSVEKYIQQQGLEHPGMRDSVETTRQLLKMTREISDDIPLMVFCSDQIEPYASALQDILQQENIAYINGVGDAIQQARERGETVTVIDGAHWNVQGHEIVAGVLYDALAQTLIQNMSDSHHIIKR